MDKKGIQALYRQQKIASVITTTKTVITATKTVITATKTVITATPPFSEARFYGGCRGVKFSFTYFTFFKKSEIGVKALFEAFTPISLIGATAPCNKRGRLSRDI